MEENGGFLKGGEIVQSIADVFQLDVNKISLYRPCEGPKNNLVVLLK